VALRIEEYALVGDTHSAALVGSDGSVDWLCLPRFDSDACLAALLGTPEHGRWLLAPGARLRRTHRGYRPGTLVLDTTFECDGGTLRVSDAMPPRGSIPTFVRVAECTAGRVPVQMELVPRFGYGKTRPWIRPLPDGAGCVGGPDALRLASTIPVNVEAERLSAAVELSAGERASFTLAWHPSHERAPTPVDALAAVADTEAYWREWSSRSTYDGPWKEAVQRSLLTLQALCYAPTGGIVAAPTTSLPEQLGGVRNWDYRFSWIRDATLTLSALLVAGYIEEARAWRDWLLRASSGHPSELQIMYGVAGERRLTELELHWLPGYQGAAPVRIGNAASVQLQLDVYGELMDALYQARRAGLPADANAWALQRSLVEHLESVWDAPDEGIWEVRSGRHRFTHSRVMAWVALDRAIRDAKAFRLDAPLEHWNALRARVHDQVCREGYDAGKNTFVQEYGSKNLDASLLMIPLVGFLPASDPRVRGTVDAVERELAQDGFVHRYRSGEFDDGFPPGEGAFLPCSFWLVDCLALLGRKDEARALFERLLAIRSDVGLLSEEYDTGARRLVGNYPQAFTHVALVNAARNLAGAGGPAQQRSAPARDER
jgi:GH15 family glucan-1,4-alpha-glucosidase